MADDAEVQNLFAALSVCHRAFMHQVAEHSPDASQRSETLWLIFRLMSRQTARTPDGIRCLTEAVHLMLLVDRDLTHDAADYFVPLLEQALAAARALQTTRAREANAMIATLPQPFASGPS
jgi:hypothetical protein